MKLKYFFLGFVTGLVFVLGGLVIVSLIIHRAGEKTLRESLSKIDVNICEITAFAITKDALDSLQFKELKTGAAYHVAKDTNNFIFVNYWATWCAPCVVKLYELEKLINSITHSFNGIKFAFVSWEKDEVLNEFIKNRNLTLPFYSSHVEERPAFINHTTIPTSYFIDKNNLIVYKFSGFKEWSTEFHKNLLLSLR